MDSAPAVPPLSADLPRPIVPGVSAQAMYGLHRFLEPTLVWRIIGRTIEGTPWLYRLFTWAEERVKGRLFGCRMCAQCAIPSTGYACPMTCPKQLRNGPCGGVSPSGACEVYPDMRCVWVTAYERADQTGHIQDLRRLQRPIDHRKWGQSSWVNYWLGRDEQLWTREGGWEELPILSVAASLRK